jgi:hypothetical protein
VREAVEKFVTSGTSGFPVMDKEGGTELKGILSLADILWHEAMEDIIEEEKVRESSERVNRFSPTNRAASLSMRRPACIVREARSVLTSLVGLRAYAGKHGRRYATQGGVGRGALLRPVRCPSLTIPHGLTASQAITCGVGWSLEVGVATGVRQTARGVSSFVRTSGWGSNAHTMLGVTELQAAHSMIRASV